MKMKMKPLLPLLLATVLAAILSPSAECLQGRHSSKIWRQGTPDSFTIRRMKKQGKRPKTVAPTVSSMPSSSPSSSPSSQPTISTAPSASPSVSPTARPSATPSSSPSFRPSISSKPSSSPTSSPTSTPSSTPTSTPSKAPSSQPTLAPTISKTPSTVPSVSPSNFPTVLTITGEKEVEGGIQQGCPVPSFLNDIDFAEETVKNITASFNYALKFNTDNIPDGMEEEDVIASFVRGIELDLQQFVFEKYVNCDSFGAEKRSRPEWEYYRKLQESESEEFDSPIGSSNVPVDERAREYSCKDTGAKSPENIKCIPMHGMFTVLYPDVASISDTMEERKVLTLVKNAIEDESLTFSNADLILEFYGKEEQPFGFKQGDVIPILGLEKEEDEFQKSSISETGGVLIGASVFIVVAALLAGGRRRKKSRFESNNAGVLTSLRGGRDFEDDYDLYEIEPVQDGDIIEVVPAPKSPQRETQETRRPNIPFPFILPVISNIDGGFKDGVEIEYHTHAGQQFAQTGESVHFMNSSQWHTGSDIDFSESIYMDDSSVRSYSTPNTVNL